MKFLFYLVPLLLALYALIECAMTPSEDMPYRIPKIAWFAIILLLTVIGPLAWIVLLRIERAERGEAAPSPREVLSKAKDIASSQTHSHETEAPQVPHTPDDDDEYLEKIQRQILREKRAKEREARKVQERQQLRDQQNNQQNRDEDSDDASGTTSTSDSASDSASDSGSEDSENPDPA